MVRSHGDYSLGNLVTRAADVVALTGPPTVGAVGLRLGTPGPRRGPDPRPAYQALRPMVKRRGGHRLCRCGCIIGSRRVHWMLSVGMEIPDWYVDFLWEYRPK